MCIMEHGNIPLLLWWIILLSPKPSPESRRTLSNVVIGKNIIIHHPNQLLFSLSSFLDIFIKFTSKPEKSQNFTCFWPEKGQKKLLLGPKNVRKILIHRPEFHIFRLGSLHLVLSLNFAVLSVSRSFQLLNLLKIFAYLASEIVITSLLRIIC